MPPATPSKSPAAGEGERGSGKTGIEEAYFCVKTNFARRDLWREATFLWMTALLTARSKAEL